jgi:hypothetical protein
MMLRKLTLLAIFIATLFGVSSLINAWPKTAVACGAIVFVLVIFFFAMENWVRKLRERE